LNKAKVFPIFGDKTFWWCVTLSPATKLLYPFWIRFSGPWSLWTLAAWLLVGGYIACALFGIWSLIRGKFRLFLIYFIPFAVLSVISFVPVLSSATLSFGLNLYNIKEADIFTKCKLETFYIMTARYQVGPCSISSNPLVPGNRATEFLVVYDSSQMLDHIDQYSDSDAWVSWTNAFNQNIHLPYGFHFNVVPIHGNFYYVSAELGELNE
jgi:hypothetical protein